MKHLCVDVPEETFNRFTATVQFRGGVRAAILGLLGVYLRAGETERALVVAMPEQVALCKKEKSNE